MINARTKLLKDNYILNETIASLVVDIIYKRLWQ